MGADVRVLALLAFLACCRSAGSASPWPDAASIPFPTREFEGDVRAETRLAIRDGGHIEFCPAESTFDFMGTDRNPDERRLATLARRDAAGNPIWQLDQPKPAAGNDESIVAAFYTSRFARVPGLWWSEATLVADRTQVFVVGFSSLASGADIVALDLGTGAQNWARHVQGLGEVAHSRYANDVRARIMDGAIVIFGHETGGDYVEVFSPSGQMLSNSVR